MQYCKYFDSDYYQFGSLKFLDRFVYEHFSSPILKSFEFFYGESKACRIPVTVWMYYSQGLLLIVWVDVF